MITYLLSAPKIAGLLPATTEPIFIVPDFSLLLKPVMRRETTAEVADRHRDMLEMAYRRHLQTPDEHFQVSRWYKPNSQKPREKHPHKVVADALVLEGLLVPHPGNNGVRSQYRISTDGIALVEACLPDWHARATHDAGVWVERFDQYAAKLFAQGWRILPEPGRSWAFEQAFENERGIRGLHRIQWIGGVDVFGWDEYHGSYFYAIPGYDYRETPAWQYFQQPHVENIPF
jgi:hypothetical protein